MNGKVTVLIFQNYLIWSKILDQNCFFPVKPLLFLDKITVKTSSDKYSGSKADIQLAICQTVCKSGGDCVCGLRHMLPVLKSKDGFQKGKKVTFSNLGSGKLAQFDFLDHHVAAKMRNVDDNWKGDVDFEFLDLNGDEFILSCDLSVRGEIKLNEWKSTAKNECSFNSKLQLKVINMSV